MKKVIYSFFILIITIMGLNKLGVFDSNIIKVDDFVFEKPLFHRSLSLETQTNLDNYDSVTFSFLSDFTDSGVIYSIKKIIDNNKYEFEFQHSVKLNSFNINYCYLLKKEIEIINSVSGENNVKEKILHIYKYPYVVSFDEINKEREEKTINQIYKDNEIILI